MKTIQLLKELKELADEWKSFSLNKRGWSTTEYADEKEELTVRCYFAPGDNFSSVNFKTYPGELGISVDYHSPVTIDGLTIGILEELPKWIGSYRKFLRRIKRREARKTKRRRERERLEEIKRLEKRLKELKGKEEK